MGEAAKTGCVVVLCGLSGTGKGITVARLQTMLPNAETWSNGNIFRALTLLCSRSCAAQVPKATAADGSASAGFHWIAFRVRPPTALALASTGHLAARDLYR